MGFNSVFKGLNMKNTIQNKKKYMCKNNTKLIYLTFIHCTYKSEKHKGSFLSENYGQTFPNKKHKQSNAHDKILPDALIKAGRPDKSCARACYVGRCYSSAFVVAS